jgi:predicted P-loop ATPase
LSSTLKTNNDELFAWAFKKWLVALVACSLDKEESNHTLLVLIGGQGIGKSRWIESILPFQLREYINSDRLKLNDKDTYIQLSQNILIILEEISSFKPSEVDAIKEVISKNIIKLRKAYGTYAESYERRASFIGSSNNEDILVDVTGNRRFLVFKVENVTHPEYIDLDKVYSQAYTLYQEGFQYWFDKDDVKKMEENNEDFRHITLEEELLLKYFSPANSVQGKSELMSPTELINEIIKKEPQAISRALSPIRMGKILKSKGFKTTKKDGSKKYIVKKKV